VEWDEAPELGDEAAAADAPATAASASASPPADEPASGSNGHATVSSIAPPAGAAAGAAAGKAGATTTAEPAAAADSRKPEYANSMPIASGVTFQAGRTPPPSASPRRNVGLIAGIVGALLVVLVGIVLLTHKSDSGSTATAAGPTSTLASTSTAAPTTAARALPTTAAVAPTTTASAPGATVTASVSDKKAKLCAGFTFYSPDDVLVMGQHIVADPDKFQQSYDDMAANDDAATTGDAALAAQITKMGPLTKTAVGVVKSGQLKTAEDVKTWLQHAPEADLETWVSGQLVMAPALKTLCS
jgi:hypothetical protein